jgi:chromosomal replication initiator protein
MSFVPTATAVLNYWVRILAALEKKINRQSYETWLKPTRFSHLEGKKLFVRIPSSDFQHIGDRYADLIQEAIENLGLDIEAVAFTTPEQDPRAPKVREDGGFAPVPSHSQNAPKQTRTGSLMTGAQSGPAPEQSRFDWNTASQLNPKYLFDAFVVGSGNQFASAAAQAVAERPSKAYNPLFLYGGVGMGKTHLMQAIGHDVKRRQPHASICYVSGEKFTNEMIDCVRYQKMTSFRDKFRNVDVLLIDDIQFLAGKERTQEEFFHTFNALQKKAESEQTQLPTDVALFIASNVRTNVRELEGALVRLIAWCSMHGVEITLAVAQTCLKQFIDTQVRKITIETIQRTVAENFGMRVAELKQKNNSRQIVVPRQIAMYLAKQLTEASLPEIGRQFGGKHHTTVMHSIAKIDEQRRADKDLNRTINKMMETLS